MDEAAAPESLLTRFGLTTFRPGQREVISAILAGRDGLCIMPTGGGKSLCFQLPSLLRTGTTLVVSPLIALMKDQVDALCARGMRASYVNSSLSPAAQAERLQQLANRQFDLMYVAPERFRSRLFLDCVRRAQIQLLAVDEAHCISEWGHDFRHDYARLGEYRQRIGMPQTIALTATATAEVRADIATQLRLRDPFTLVAGFSRPNLRLAVKHCDNAGDKHHELVRFLRRTPGSGIIYCSTRRACEDIASTIPAIAGRRVVMYHGGMEADTRRKMQDAFMNGDDAIAVATNAFGMGIDKADVRFVVHYNFPGSVEAYYQEAGRAGRDGKLAECLLLYLPSDRAIHRFFIESAYPDPEVVQAVYEFLRTHADDPVELTQAELKEALGLKISTEGVGTCERLLEKAGALERLEPHRNMAIVRIQSDLPTLVDLLPPQAASQRRVMRFAEQFVGDARGDDVFFHPAGWANDLDMTPSTLTRILRDLTRLESFDYVPPFRGRAVRVKDRQRSFRQLELDFAQLQQRKEADYRKLEHMVRCIHTHGCRQEFILRYFGDPLAASCRVCDLCAPSLPHHGDAPVPLAENLDSDSQPTMSRTQACHLAEAPEVHEALRIVLSGVARAKERVGKNLIVGMLAGSQSEKVRKQHLDRLSTFGRLTHLKQADIGLLVDICLTERWLQQTEKERYRPLLQLTPQGTELMRRPEPPQAVIYLPYDLLLRLKHQRTYVERSPPAAASVDPSDRLRSTSATTVESVIPDVHEDAAPEPAYWTGRVLMAGFSIAECVAIRGLSRETIVAHALDLIDQGWRLQAERIFTPEECGRLQDGSNLRVDPPSQSRPPAYTVSPNAQEVLLFSKCRSVAKRAPADA